MFALDIANTNTILFYPGFKKIFAQILLHPNTISLILAICMKFSLACISRFNAKLQDNYFKINSWIFFCVRLNVVDLLSSFFSWLAGWLLLLMLLSLAAQFLRLFLCSRVSRTISESGSCSDSSANAFAGIFFSFCSHILCIVIPMGGKLLGVNQRHDFKIEPL